MSDSPQTNKALRAWRYLLPLAIFFGLLWFMWRGLSLNPREIPSALLNKPVPAFSLPLLHDPSRSLGAADMKGKVWLLNVWGSWCASCRYEHPVLNALAKKGVIPIIGLNWKDRPEDAKSWLVKFGDPYQFSVSDIDGRVGIDFGVYGAPETFIIDKAGMIRYKHTGPISEVMMNETLIPMIQGLNKA